MRSQKVFHFFALISRRQWPPKVPNWQGLRALHGALPGPYHHIASPRQAHYCHVFRPSFIEHVPTSPPTEWRYSALVNNRRCIFRDPSHAHFALDKFGARRCHPGPTAQPACVFCLTCRSVKYCRYDRRGKPKSKSIVYSTCPRFQGEIYGGGDKIPVPVFFFFLMIRCIKPAAFSYHIMVTDVSLWVRTRAM